MRRIGMGALAGLVITGCLGVVRASAESAVVVVEDLSPVLPTPAEDGTREINLGITNLTVTPLQLSAEPRAEADAGCRIALDPATLPVYEKTAVMATIAAGCAIAEDGFDFVLSVSEGPDIEITAVPSTGEDATVWKALLAFPLLMAGLLIVVFILWRVWSDRPELKETLDNLESGWSFKESWASNVTAIAAVLTGLFGTTDTATALLGEDAEKSIALAIVGAAVATGFAAAGPVVLNGVRRRTEPGNDVTHPVVGGLLLATSVTLTGAFGELVIMWATARRLELGGFESWVWLPALFAAAILGVYAFTATRDVLRLGIADPPASETSDAIKAAVMIVAALRDRSIDDTQALVEELAGSYPGLRTSLGDEPTRRRSAVL